MFELIRCEPCEYIEVDFSSVEYISRSFADQFHFDKMSSVAASQKQIILSNASDAVINMLQAVEHTQNAANRKAAPVPVYKYSSYQELEDFLLSF